MTAASQFNSGSDPHPLSPDGLRWAERVVQADRVWKQINRLLKSAGAVLPKTPRRPDVRLILNNVSGHEQRFLNPGDHSGSREEIVPATGNETAAMVMMGGTTLGEQIEWASLLFNTYALATAGLSDRFVTALTNDVKQFRNDSPGFLVREAYGPAPFTEQVGKLTEVRWPQAGGAAELVIRPQIGPAGAFGARAATNEMAILCEFPIFVKGTDTTPERVESDGMVIVVEEDWKSGVVKTRPVAPSVARDFYGVHYAGLPRAIVEATGRVQAVDLRNGTVLQRETSARRRQPRPGSGAVAGLGE